MKDPKTPKELRSAAAMATACLLLDSARRYSLVKGGPKVNVDRCFEIIARAKKADCSPTKAEEDAAIRSLIEAHATP